MNGIFWIPNRDQRINIEGCHGKVQEKYNVRTKETGSEQSA